MSVSDLEDKAFFTGFGSDSDVSRGLIWWSHDALRRKLNKALRTQTNLSAGKNSLLVLVSPGDLLIIIKKD